MLQIFAGQSLPKRTSRENIPADKPQSNFTRRLETFIAQVHKMTWMPGGSLPRNVVQQNIWPYKSQHASGFKSKCKEFSCF
jgi:hypothetical protein